MASSRSNTALVRAATGLLVTTIYLSPQVARAQSWLPSAPAPAYGARYAAPPWLSLVGPGQSTNAQAWRAELRRASAKRRLRRFRPKARIRRNGRGITTIRRFGTTRFQQDAVRINGQVPPLPAPTSITTAEENGSLATATNTGLVAGQAVTISSVLGDGAFGTTSGDFDLYKLEGLSAGQVIRARLVPAAGFNPVVVVYDNANNFYAVGSGNPAETSFGVPFGGDWFVLVAGADTFQADVTDPGSGFGAGSTGSYALELALDYFVEEEFQFTLRKGDVLGAAINGGTGLVIRDRRGDVRMASGGDTISGVAPASSPLLAGEATAAYVVDKPGIIRVTARATGAYTLDLIARRSPLESGGRRDKQIIFIDFDGGTFNLADTLPFFPLNEDVTLSPLSAFLPDWGLTAADEDAVIDAILAVAKKSLKQDIAANGRNPRFDIEILNSRDHADPFGHPNVSRVIVGGTIDEFQIGTIGIAGSIDIGNFRTEETAYVLLDILSGRLPTPLDLDTIPRAAGVSVFDVIGAGVGEIVAHEAGHYLGNFHTDQFNAVPNIMDQGGNLEQSVLGLGPDGIFGTADDVDVEFVRDVFVPNEGFQGEENTTANVAFGCTTRRRGFRRP